MSDSKRITITILDNEYPIVTDENEAIIYKAAQLVDHIMRNIVEKGGVKDAAKAAVLTALQCAVDTIKQKESEIRCRTKANDLISTLEKAL